MNMHLTRSLRLAAAVLLVPSLLAGCAAKGGGVKDTSYVARDVDTLYLAAQDRLQRGQYKLAAGLFDEVERQHPYSTWARRAQLMSAYSYWLAQDHTKSIDAANRFLSIHPGNRDAPYASYLVALNYYEQISDIKRDQKTTRDALNALGEVMRRYPDTRYAADAKLKIDLDVVMKKMYDHYEEVTHSLPPFPEQAIRDGIMDFVRDGTTKTIGRIEKYTDRDGELDMKRILETCERAVRSPKALRELFAAA